MSRGLVFRVEPRAGAEYDRAAYEAGSPKHRPLPGVAMTNTGWVLSKNRPVRPVVGPDCPRRAVSLQEVLVVIAIVLFILALLIPGLSDARERARRLVCANNLRQWGSALVSYRDDNRDFLPMEGPAGGKFDKSGTWYNELPQYLGLPAYRDAEHYGKLIKEFPELHVWICPSKSRTQRFKSDSGMNQFHYGMNQVLDGLGTPTSPSADAPGFLNQGGHPRATEFAMKPNTVFLFDIAPNSPGGTPRQVATRYQRAPLNGEYHGDYANVLFVDGGVGNCTTDDLVTKRSFQTGKVIWTNPRLYWGYPRP